MNRHTLMKQLVIEEATNLKKHALKKELKNLNFNKFNPDHTLSCIYGQIANGCFTPRAVELMKKCASRGYDRESAPKLVDCKINGPIIDLPRSYFWSPIEVFIVQDRNRKNGNNKLLIDFLKGETNELNFK